MLADSVLVLNNIYLAVQVTTVKDSIKDIVTGNAKVIDNEYRLYSFKEWATYTNTNKNNINITTKYSGILHSPSIEIFAPQVIIFSTLKPSKSIERTVKYSRQSVFKRDNYICQYCKNNRVEFTNQYNRKSIFTIDHIIPKSKGGPSSWKNVVTSCKWCNREKGDSLLKDLGWSLPTKPKKPKWNSHIGTPFKKQKKEYWNTFLK